MAEELTVDIWLCSGCRWLGPSCQWRQDRRVGKTQPLCWVHWPPTPVLYCASGHTGETHSDTYGVYRHLDGHIWCVHACVHAYRL